MASQAVQGSNTHWHMCGEGHRVEWAELNSNIHRCMQEPGWDVALTGKICYTHWHMQQPGLGLSLVEVAPLGCTSH